MGSWGISGGLNPYGSDSLWSSSAGSSYLFSSGSSGKLSLDLWWTTFSSRCANTNVAVFDGTNLIASLQLDQRSNGGQWVRLGVYSFSQEARLEFRPKTAAAAARMQRASWRAARNRLTPKPVAAVIRKIPRRSSLTTGSLAA